MTTALDFQLVKSFGQLNGGRPIMTLSLSERDGAAIYLLRLQALPDNRFNPPFLKAYNQALDYLEDHVVDKGIPAALISTGSGKFFSNGLDLKWIAKTGDVEFLKREFWPFLVRMIEFPLPTVCCQNGHTIAGGMLTALSHDYRVMNQERGFMWMSELEIGLPISPPLTAVLQAKISDAQVFREVTSQATKYTAQQALECKLVDAVGADEASTLALAVELAKAKAQIAAKAGRNLGTVKRDNYALVRETVDKCKETFDFAATAAKLVKAKM